MTKPPYTITPLIIDLAISIGEKLGMAMSHHLYKPSIELRKRNRIKTIQASLAIEGNTLSIHQTTAILDNKRVLAPAKDLLEVQNAIRAYQNMASLQPFRMDSFLLAHRQLMLGLVKEAGKFRNRSVGTIKGNTLTHLAPPASRVKGLMTNLFQYVKKDKDSFLIKSCVFHYELEFIHPFEDGNGRMGRFWQTRLLMQHNPLFEFLPVEHIIQSKQKQYYKVLNMCDRLGHSTLFIEFMLKAILQALDELLSERPEIHITENRLELFKTIWGEDVFRRKDYLTHFKHISAPTASRDLKKGLKEGVILSKGAKNQTLYWFK